MSKDHSEEHSKDPKKKMVVVEEVSITEAPEEVEEAKVEEPSTVETPVERQEVPDPLNEEPEKTNYLFIIIPTALLVGALVGGLITYFSGLSRLSGENQTPSPVPTVVVEEPNATSTPSSSFKRDELKIQVLNGSGVSGAAGKAKTFLEGLGYTSVDTGNASVSDLAQTEVAIKDTKKENLADIIKDLAKSYEAVEAAKPLVATSKYDIVITIGRK
jgi:hypothetical protein